MELTEHGKELISVFCPRCGASSREPCTYKDGRPMLRHDDDVFIHNERAEIRRHVERTKRGVNYCEG